MLLDNLRIPKSRVAALIGHLGKTKKELEQKTHAKIKIDSQTGEIEVSAKKDAIGFYSAMTIVKAIGRGFSPEHAFWLLDENVGLEIVSLSDWLAGKKSAIAAKKSRIIGTAGKVRVELEEKTDCFISVQGKTVCIIGEYENIAKAKKAIEMILTGARHATVFEQLNRYNRETRFEL